MVNVLKSEKREQVVALGRLKWSLRRIESETGVRRETVAKALRRAGIEVGPAGRWGHGASAGSGEGVSTDPVTLPGAKPANADQVSTDPVTLPAARPANADQVSTDPVTLPGAKPANAGQVSTDPLTLPGAKPANAGQVSTDPVTLPAAKPTNGGQVSTDSAGAGITAGPHVSHCEPHRSFIEESLDLRRNAVAIYQDLVDDHGFRASYKSVARFVTRLRRERGEHDAPCGVIETAPGEEMQVDWGEGPMVRYPPTGEYRRTRMFVLTLGYSRKSVRLLSFHSSSLIWAQLHEQAFRRLGGVTALVVLDNLKEGVLQPDIWDPILNPLYAAMLKHYGIVGHACRVRDPDRKGKVERAVGHAQGTPLKGLRFETLELARAHLDRWEERWADTRIHGTTRKQVVTMFNLERAQLKALPVEPFRHFEYGVRTVHSLDGCVQVDAAWYEAPPGMFGQELGVQWDDHVVRIMSRTHSELLVEHARKQPGKHSLVFAQPSRTPPRIETLLNRAARAGKHIGALCQSIHGHEGVAGVRRIQGVLGLAKTHGVDRVDEVCRMGLDVGVPSYKFVKRFIKHHPATQLVAKMDPIIRDLTEYRDVIRRMTGDSP